MSQSGGVGVKWYLGVASGEQGTGNREIIKSKIRLGRFAEEKLRAEVPSVEQTSGTETDPLRVQ
ncbi:MAG: hypothetical protein AAFY21_14405 [Cyanobacteria bacterium J06641_2]